ncbi:MAG: hypothetical protein PHH49_07885 [Candidatus Omnitrophica bacterium]|nr:hypothetical protein [Candidatus Omnitrophota bacterium]MDD5488857.1 hypothetical protein [Candidatus Omnitrophota bacterium]
MRFPRVSIGRMTVLLGVITVTSLIFGVDLLALRTLVAFVLLAFIWEFSCGVLEEKASGVLDVRVATIFSIIGILVGCCLVSSIFFIVLFKLGPMNVVHIINCTIICAVPLVTLAVVTMVVLLRNIRREERKLLEVNGQLEITLEEIDTLSELLPICSWCKKMRDDKGYWIQLEKYFENYSRTQVLSSLCPECAEKKRLEAQ